MIPPTYGDDVKADLLCQLGDSQDVEVVGCLLVFVMV